MNLTFIFPMAAMVFLTFVVGAITFRGRVRAVKERKVSLAYFKTFSDGQPTDEILKAQQHFVNLFEAPVLFYAFSLAAMLVPGMGGLELFLAWVYVGARFVHTWIHMGSNKVLYRMQAFMASMAVLFLLWLLLVYKTAAIYFLSAS